MYKYGRILRGKTEEDFETLSDDPNNRPTVMLMDEDGLNLLSNKSGIEMLEVIGYEKNYIQKKIQEGNQFRLVTFTLEEQLMPATWQQVANIIQVLHPEIATNLQGAIPMLSTTPFAAIEQLAGVSFGEIETHHITDPRYMTHQRYINSNRDTIATRAFLYFTFHLKELYSGDGFTYDYHGQRGLREYMIPNVSLQSLSNMQLTTIEIKEEKKRSLNT